MFFTQRFNHTTITLATVDQLSASRDYSVCDLTGQIKQKRLSCVTSWYLLPMYALWNKNFLPLEITRNYCYHSPICGTEVSFVVEGTGKYILKNWKPSVMSY